MNLAEQLPCICTNPNCGYQFVAQNPISGAGSNILFIGNATTCPKCGYTANYANWGTDSSGNFHLHGFFKFIKEIKNVETLKKIQTELKIANKITPAELADTLVEIDSNFVKFYESIKAIPPSEITPLIQTLIMILTLVLTYQISITSDKQYKETTSILEKQQKLENEKFEYQKQRDLIEDKEKYQAKIKSEELEKKIQKLESSFERKLKALKNPNLNKQSVKPSNKLKNSDRNKPCLCGSGKKAKKCHPNGF